MHALAYVRHAMGRHAEAQMLYKQALEIIKTTLLRFWASISDEAGIACVFIGSPDHVFLHRRLTSFATAHEDRLPGKRGAR